MSDKELNGCCGGHDHDKDHECGCGDGCGCGHDHEETMVVDLEKEDGTIISCPIVDAFEYNGNGYALVYNEEEEGIYLFKEEGEEGELVVPDEAEFEEVTKYYEENIAE
ncbi:MAG: DUF1292 domain-containing protein [Sarcina sp.]